MTRDEEFVSFVRSDRARLEAMARMLTAGDHHWAEDMATLTRVYLKWPTVRRADNRLGYARTVLTRVFIDDTRRAHRRRETLVDEPVLTDRAAPRDGDSGADERLLVLAALRDLSPGQRAVVLLRHWLDYDVVTTAKMLRLRPGTVKAKTHVPSNTFATCSVLHFTQPTQGAPVNETRLQQLLTQAADDTYIAPDPACDLGRARAAQRHQSRHRYSTGLAGVAALAVLAAGSTSLLVDRDHPSTLTQRQTPDIHEVRLVRQTLPAGPYTFGTTPVGWHVESDAPTSVTIVPDDGSTDPDPDIFTGKLVILFDGNPLGGGTRAVREGRELFYGQGSGYTTVSTATLPGEPTGVVRIQFPSDTGWTVDAMLDFLASVRVGDGALQGLG